MEWIKALILGIVQGLTEFLPVSSSGHIEIAKYILGDQFSADQNLTMTIALHFATALSTVVVFRSDIGQLFNDTIQRKPASIRFLLYIFISMLPAGIVGFLFQDQLKAFFDEKIVLVGFCLLFTGFLLFIANRAKASQKEIGLVDAIIIGLSQAVALLPGVSRSGSTIATSVLLGVDRTQSARFSFLMVLPLIFLKVGKDLLDFESLNLNKEFLLHMGVGFVAAFFTGVFACKLMIKLVQKSGLHYFSYYCWVVGLLAIIVGWT